MLAPEEVVVSLLVPEQTREVWVRASINPSSSVSQIRPSLRGEAMLAPEVATDSLLAPEVAISAQTSKYISEPLALWRGPQS